MGLATVRALLDGRAKVLLTGRNERNVEAARRELGDRALVVRSDAAGMPEVHSLGALVKERFGAIDFLHVNAGISEPGAFSEVTEQTYDRVFAVNTKGAFFTAQSLEGLGAATYLSADAGLASLHDLALLSGMYGLLAGFLHATALVDSEGVRAGAFLELLTPWMTAMMGDLPQYAEKIDSGRHGVNVVSNLGMQAAFSGEHPHRHPRAGRRHRSARADA